MPRFNSASLSIAAAVPFISAATAAPFVSDRLPRCSSPPLLLLFQIVWVQACS
ncbi:BnaC07g33870D [Brassica napus]|uniref:BnaC07g33870D protein n=1 Tax=Brassica napus TaxID=3708 RepID=A0A078F9J1_BRANA|nr:BnaC07g33870D [Brassica napus]